MLGGMVVAPTYPEKKRLNLLEIMLRRMVVAPLTFWLIYVQRGRNGFIFC
jgi:hypothetical protein